MRRMPLAALLLGLLSAGPALAQQPFTLDFGAPRGPVRYATEQVASVRFLGEKAPGPSLEAGDQVEIVTEKDGWVRVKKGDRYGWVPAAKLAEQAPARDPG